MEGIDTSVIGTTFSPDTNGVDNKKLIAVNDALRNHPVEKIGKTLRASMTAMKRIV
jgi:ketol-acid reductoisomerase